MTGSMHEGVDGEPGFGPVGVVGTEVCVGVFLDPFQLVAFFFVGQTGINIRDYRMRECEAGEGKGRGGTGSF